MGAHHHKEWLMDNEMIEFDPLQDRKWHKRFDLENVKDIEISRYTKAKKSMNEINTMMKEQENKLKEIVEKEMDSARKMMIMERVSIFRRI
eukprot:TRINITY_DN1958_c0_g1_i1.p1 TRINITY_DN1958_c0_g1~~TRINITY_DN1958_c0_g1_i1.p1  ORF type:complete len:103 (-),score=51.99 TRINITY_DN1958_c0_g1_i1:179-451(-)